VRRVFVVLTSHGITSDLFPSGILIQVAIIGYARQPDFEVDLPGGLAREERLAHAMLHDEILRKALADEGVDPTENDRVCSALMERWKRRARPGIKL
jgi:hypothetical protein